jgi:transcriptional regulator with XRE-family HTH domain
MAARRQEKSQQRYDLLPVQCRMARIALEWGVRELAAEAQVSTDTVARFERGEELKERTVRALREAMEAAGVEFIPENGGGPGVRLKKRKAKR